MGKDYQRRTFLKHAAMAGIGLGITGPLSVMAGKGTTAAGGRVGIIGLDTSHSVAFTKALNAASPKPEFAGYKVVAAYPKGSNDIESSVKRIPGYIKDVAALGVEIVDSIETLLKKVDVVLLETNDGRLHLEQALPVLKAGKPLFIDKPVAASLRDAIAIYDAAEKYKVPVFSSSSLRFMNSAMEVVSGKIGKVIGADTYCPANIEPTHPDLFWYGIHGIETLFTVMGTGCKSVIRVHTPDTDVVVGTWEDNRLGTFRGKRSGKHDYGGTAYGETGTAILGPFDGYEPLLLEIIAFFKTGKPPVSSAETLEILAFMEAADESKRRNGASVTLAEMMEKAKRK